MDLGLIEGKRDRQTFKTRDEAETHAEKARIQKQNEGLTAFALPKEIRVDAAKATEILKPHGVTVSNTGGRSLIWPNESTAPMPRIKSQGY